MKTLLQITEDAEQVCGLITELIHNDAELIALLAIVESTMKNIIFDNGVKQLDRFKAMQK